MQDRVMDPVTFETIKFVDAFYEVGDCFFYSLHWSGHRAEGSNERRGIEDTVKVQVPLFKKDIYTYIGKVFYQIFVDINDYDENDKTEYDNYNNIDYSKTGKKLPKYEKVDLVLNEKDRKNFIVDLPKNVNTDMYIRLKDAIGSVKDDIDEGSEPEPDYFENIASLCMSLLYYKSSNEIEMKRPYVPIWIAKLASHVLQTIIRVCIYIDQEPVWYEIDDLSISCLTQTNKHTSKFLNYFMSYNFYQIRPLMEKLPPYRPADIIGTDAIYHIKYDSEMKHFIPGFVIYNP